MKILKIGYMNITQRSRAVMKSYTCPICGETRPYSKVICGMHKFTLECGIMMIGYRNVDANGNIISEDSQNKIPQKDRYYADEFHCYTCDSSWLSDVWELDR